jgi:hypothetical protein
MKLDPYLSPCIKINSNWIKDRNARGKHREPLEDIGIGHYFLIRPQIA